MHQRSLSIRKLPSPQETFRVKKTIGTNFSFEIPNSGQVPCQFSPQEKLSGSPQFRSRRSKRLDEGEKEEEGMEDTTQRSGLLLTASGNGERERGSA
ncbi:unnamed protein product, partial [Iphiclides podalirius]